MKKTVIKAANRYLKAQYKRGGMVNDGTGDQRYRKEE